MKRCMTKLANSVLIESSDKAELSPCCKAKFGEFQMSCFPSETVFFVVPVLVIQLVW